MNSLIFLYVVYFVSIGIHTITLLISLIFVFPLQLKESKVKDGVSELRRLMLFMGMTNIFLSIITIFVLSYRLFLEMHFIEVPLDTMRYLMTVVIFSHSLGFLAFSIIQYRIYHTQYHKLDEKIK